MIEAALAKLEASLTRQLDISVKELREENHTLKLDMERGWARFEKAMLELENRMEKRINHTLYMNITVLGALIAIVGAITTFSHYFLH